MSEEGGASLGPTERLRLVEAVRALNGVAGVELTPGGPGGFGTLRVQLAPGTDDVVMAVEVNELLRRQFGLAVDADRLEVVEETTAWPQSQAATAAPPPRPSPAGPSPSPSPAGVPPTGPPPAGAPSPALSPSWGDSRRVVLTRVVFASEGLGTQVTVTVNVGGASYDGVVDVGAAPGAVTRAAAQATLAAVQAALAALAARPVGQAPGGATGGPPVRLELDRVEVSGHEPDAVATVVVSMLTRSGLLRHAGAALVQGDARHAVVRATLAAVNRRLEPHFD